ncbi:MAG: B12-binding domain-containing radical SAM protein, partial [Nanobdellota archaeon]
DNYLVPQALPCLAAFLRENKIPVELLDCSPLKIGWKSLEKILKKKKPDVICISEPETMWSNEGIKLAKLSKKISSKIYTIAGGAHFSLTAKETLKETEVDFVIEGEGEVTLLELIKEMKKEKPKFRKVKGISYKKKGSIIKTEPRELIENLDDLPLPAYDLLPMEKYGKASYLFHPGGVTIHHSRGCPYNCDFCVCWKHMSKKTNKGCKASWRTKSVEKTIEEIKLLYYKYNKRGFVFTDDNWNYDPKWSSEFADKIIKNKLKIRWFAFMRADQIVRDEKLGVLKKLVKAGLRHISIGVERFSDEEVKGLNKNVSKETTIKAFKILRNRYPQVFSQGTFIIGIEEETPSKIKNLAKFIKTEVKPDYPSFSPLTPIPGTKTYEKAKKENKIEIHDFEYYDWYTPIMSSKYMNREEIEYGMYWLNKQNFSPLNFISNIFSKNKYKRKLYMWFLIVTLRLYEDTTRRAIGLKPRYNFQKKRNNMISNLYIPKWYNR